MKKLTPDQIKRIQEKRTNEIRKYKSSLMVCAGTGCVSADSLTLKELLEKELRKNSLQDKYLVVPTGCNGFCAQGPILVIQPEGIFYQKVSPELIPEIIENLENETYVEKLLFQDKESNTLIPKMENIKFFSKQRLIALRNKGIIDPENIDDSIARGAYLSLVKIMDMKKFRIERKRWRRISNREKMGSFL